MSSNHLFIRLLPDGSLLRLLAVNQKQGEVEEIIGKPAGKMEVNTLWFHQTWLELS